MGSRFSKALLCGYALIAELMSILEGLILSKSDSFEYIIILSDSTQAINLVSENVIYNDIYYNVLKNCRVHKQEFKETNFAYVRREKSKLAPYLSQDCRRHFSNLNIVRDLPHPPINCNELLLSD